MNSQIIHTPIKFSIKTNNLDKLHQKLDKSLPKESVNKFDSKLQHSNDILTNMDIKRDLDISESSKTVDELIFNGIPVIKKITISKDICKKDILKRSLEENEDDMVSKLRKVNDSEDTVIIEPETSSKLVIHPLPKCEKSTFSSDKFELNSHSKGIEALNMKEILKTLEEKMNNIDKICKTNPQTNYSNNCINEKVNIQFNKISLIMQPKKVIVENSAFMEIDDPKPKEDSNINLKLREKQLKSLQSVMEKDKAENKEKSKKGKSDCDKSYRRDSREDKWMRSPDKRDKDKRYKDKNKERVFSDRINDDHRTSRDYERNNHRDAHRKRHQDDNFNRRPRFDRRDNRRNDSKSMDKTVQNRPPRPELKYTTLGEAIKSHKLETVSRTEPRDKCVNPALSQSEQVLEDSFQLSAHTAPPVKDKSRISENIRKLLSKKNLELARPSSSAADTAPDSGLASLQSISSQSDPLDNLHEVIPHIVSSHVSPSPVDDPVDDSPSQQGVSEENVPEESVPEESVPEESVSEESVPEESVPEESVPEESVPPMPSPFIKIRNISFKISPKKMQSSNIFSTVAADDETPLKAVAPSEPVLSLVEDCNSTVTNVEICDDNWLRPTFKVPFNVDKRLAKACPVEWEVEDEGQAHGRKETGDWTEEKAPVDEKDELREQENKETDDWIEEKASEEEKDEENKELEEGRQEGNKKTEEVQRVEEIEEEEENKDMEIENEHGKEGEIKEMEKEILDEQHKTTEVRMADEASIGANYDEKDKQEPINGLEILGPIEVITNSMEEIKEMLDNCSGLSAETNNVMGGEGVGTIGQVDSSREGACNVESVKKDSHCEAQPPRSMAQVDDATSAKHGQHHDDKCDLPVKRRSRNKSQWPNSPKHKSTARKYLKHNPESRQRSKDLPRDRIHSQQHLRDSGRGNKHDKDEIVGGRHLRAHSSRRKYSRDKLPQRRHSRDKSLKRRHSRDKSPRRSKSPKRRLSYDKSVKRRHSRDKSMKRRHSGDKLTKRRYSKDKPSKRSKSPKRRQSRDKSPKRRQSREKSHKKRQSQDKSLKRRLSKDKSPKRRNSIDKSSKRRHSRDKSMKRSKSDKRRHSPNQSTKRRNSRDKSAKRRHSRDKSVKRRHSRDNKPSRRSISSDKSMKKAKSTKRRHSRDKSVKRRHSRDKSTKRSKSTKRRHSRDNKPPRRSASSFKSSETNTSSNSSSSSGTSSSSSTSGKSTASSTDGRSSARLVPNRRKSRARSVRARKAYQTLLDKTAPAVAPIAPAKASTEKQSDNCDGITIYCPLDEIQCPPDIVPPAVAKNGCPAVGRRSDVETAVVVVVDESSRARKAQMSYVAIDELSIPLPETVPVPSPQVPVPAVIPVLAVPPPVPVAMSPDTSQRHARAAAERKEALERENRLKKILHQLVHGSIKTDPTANNDIAPRQPVPSAAPCTEEPCDRRPPNRDPPNSEPAISHSAVAPQNSCPSSNTQSSPAAAAAEHHITMAHNVHSHSYDHNNYSLTNVFQPTVETAFQATFDNLWFLPHEYSSFNSQYVTNDCVPYLHPPAISSLGHLQQPQTTDIDYQSKLLSVFSSFSFPAFGVDDRQVLLAPKEPMAISSLKPYNHTAVPQHHSVNKKSSTSSLMNEVMDMDLGSDSYRSVDSHRAIDINDELSDKDDLSSCGDFEYEDSSPLDPFEKFPLAPRPEYEHIIETEVHPSAIGKRFEYAYLKSTVCNCVPPNPDEIKLGKTACDENCFNRRIKVECNRKCPVYELCTNRRFQDQIYTPFEPFYCANDKGWGIRSTNKIYPGTFIIEYVGELIDFHEFLNRIRHKSEYNHHFIMAIQKDMYIDAGKKGNWSRFVNHSCDPNTIIERWVVNGKTRIGFFSKKFIAENEEITIDYQFQQYGMIEQKCFCNSPNCTGIMGKVNEKLQEQIKTSHIRVRKELIQKIISRGCLKDISHVSDMITVFKEECLDRDTFYSFLHVLIRTDSEICIRTFIECGGLKVITSYLDSVPWNDWPLKLLYLQCLDHFKLKKRTILSSGCTAIKVVECWAENPRYTVKHSSEPDPVKSSIVDDVDDSNGPPEFVDEALPFEKGTTIKFTLTESSEPPQEEEKIETEIKDLALNIKRYFADEKEKFYIPKKKIVHSDSQADLSVNDSESKSKDSASRASSVQGDYVKSKRRRIRRKCTEAIQKLSKDEFRRLFSERHQKSLVEKNQVAATDNNNSSLSKVDTNSIDAFQVVKKLLSNVIIDEINRLKHSDKFQTMPDEFQNLDLDKILSDLNIVGHEGLLSMMNQTSDENKNSSASSYSNSSSKSLDECSKSDTNLTSQKPSGLPPNWNSRRSESGRLYFYNIITKKTQWDIPVYPWDGGEEDPMAYNFGSASDFLVTREDVQIMNEELKKRCKLQKIEEKRKHRLERSIQRKLNLTPGERNKIEFSKEVFRAVKTIVKPYNTSSCKVGRIQHKHDLKFLCEKFADTIITKEVKLVANLEDLEINANVRSKIKTYIEKYMSNQGRFFKRSQKTKPKSKQFLAAEHSVDNWLTNTSQTTAELYNQLLTDVSDSPRFSP